MIDVLINSVGGILSQCEVYQIVMLHILNILQFCQLYHSKAEKISHLSHNGLHVKITIFHESPPTVLIFYVKLVRFNVPWNTITGIQKDDYSACRKMATGKAKKNPE